MRISGIRPGFYYPTYTSSWRAGSLGEDVAAMAGASQASEAAGASKVAAVSGTAQGNEVSGTGQTSRERAAAEMSLQGVNPSVNPESEEDPAKKVGAIKNPGQSKIKKAGKESSPAECQTCSERKYQDGSNECNVSFKSAAHISPTAAGSAVRAHEQEHVDNAYKKAKQNGGKVLQASVAIHTAICPECGRTYVSGGETTTKIAYGRDEDKNPFKENMKNRDAGLLRGMNFNAAG